MQNMNQRPAADAPLTIPPIVWVLTGCIGLIGSNSLALGPIAPSIAADLTTSVQTVMAASAGFGLGTALGALALGQLIDRVGPQRILVHVMLLMAAGFAVCGTSGRCSSARSSRSAWRPGWRCRRSIRLPPSSRPPGARAAPSASS
jgi:predicted MFS family arabinose efflux permease